MYLKTPEHAESTRK